MPTPCLLLPGTTKNSILLREERREEWVFTSLSTASVILRRDRNPELGRNSLLLGGYFQGIFQLQKDHRQPSTMPHIYIATKPIRSWGSSGDSNQQAHAWELGARHCNHSQGSGRNRHLAQYYSPTKFDQNIIEPFY